MLRTAASLATAGRQRMEAAASLQDELLYGSTHQDSVEMRKHAQAIQAGLGEAAAKLARLGSDLNEYRNIL